MATPKVYAVFNVGLKMQSTSLTQYVLDPMGFSEINDGLRYEGDLGKLLLAGKLAEQTKLGENYLVTLELLPPNEGRGFDQYASIIEDRKREE